MIYSGARYKPGLVLHLYPRALRTRMCEIPQTAYLAFRCSTRDNVLMGAQTTARFKENSHHAQRREQRQACTSVHQRQKVGFTCSLSANQKP